MDVGSIVADVVTCEARQCGGAFAGPLTDETPSADKGLDSLGFASVMVALERAIGRDPFADEDEISYPKTFGELVVALYRND